MYHYSFIYIVPNYRYASHSTIGIRNRS